MEEEFGLFPWKANSGCLMASSGHLMTLLLQLQGHTTIKQPSDFIQLCVLRGLAQSEVGLPRGGSTGTKCHKNLRNSSAFIT